MNDDSIRPVDVDLSGYSEAHIPGAWSTSWGQAVNEFDEPWTGCGGMISASMEMQSVVVTQ